MDDRFDKFIKDHQSEFDIFEPSEDLWRGIEKKLDKKKTIRWQFYITRVSAVAAIFVLSFIIQRFFFSDADIQFSLKRDVEIKIPELQEAELYYTGLIDEKLNEVKPLLSEYPSLEEELHQDLTQLDSIYASLKEDLKDDVANQEVLEAMIQNYRLRIQILEDMLEFLNDNNEKSNIKSTEYEL